MRRYIQARGNVTNGFALKKEDFGGVSVILQPFGQDGVSLEGEFPHATFQGTTEAPHDSEGSWFKPIAPFTISPAGFGLYIDNLFPSITVVGGGPGVAKGVNLQNEPPNFYARTFTAFNNRAPGTTGYFKLALGSEDECVYSALEGFTGQVSPAYVTLRQKAAAVMVVVRTTSIYKGEPFFSVRYQLLDSNGRPQILTAGVTVTMEVDRRKNSDKVVGAGRNSTNPSPHPSTRPGAMHRD